MGKEIQRKKPTPGAVPKAKTKIIKKDKPASSTQDELKALLASGDSKKSKITSKQRRRLVLIKANP